MKNTSSHSDPRPANRTKKKKSQNFCKNDPFARPPHPLGFQFLSDERPLRASKFGSIMPSIVAKYGLGRKLGVEKINAAWRESLAAVFQESYEGEFDWNSDDEGTPSKLETFLKFARPVSFRGGVLRVELASNLLFQELQFYQSAILRELKTRLPDENVEKLKVVVR